MASSTRTVHRPTLGVSSTEARLWLVAVGALLGDLLLTYYGIAHAGLSEGNPLAASVLAGHGYAGLAAMKVAAFAVAAGGRQVVPPAYRWIAPICLAVPWLLAVTVNTALILGTL
ncbi:DUF5658 family protein [Halobacterium wangiae]|uniref:DUF5658 family protein n=1 Tax=Halobacterium wangiae TaxID=2902623 RepID=UPI001E473908|nr:DUF5658 family protein [Halobacterium wangiae]